MPSVQRTVVINRPIENVFNFFADVSNDPLWRGESVKEIAVDGPMVKGARVHQKLAVGPLGSTVKADMDVVTYDPPTALAFEVVTGPLRPRVAFTFAPTADGTEVNFSIEAAVTGLKKMMMGRMAEQSMQAEAAALDAAKHLLES